MTLHHHASTVLVSGFRAEPAAASAWVTLDRPVELRHTAVGGGPVSGNIDGFLAAALLPAMRSGARLRAEDPVSSSLLVGVERIQTILHAWCPELVHIEVDAASRSPQGSRRATGIAAFFSGGVDSLYTALKHRDELTALVFIAGFDIRLERSAARTRCVRLARAAAAALGKPLVEVETSIRSFSRPYVGWGLYHGAALASVASFLAPRFGKVYIPSSLSYDSYFPHGSHPLLDPLWTTEELELVHDGFEANRYEKTAFVAASDAALRFLRVCNRSTGSIVNCGRCEKCLRTMVALRVLGVLEDCRTFAAHPDLEAIPAVLAGRDWANRDLWEQNLRAAEQAGDDPVLLRTLRNALGRPGRAPTRRRVSWRSDRSRLVVPTRGEREAAGQRLR